MEEALRQIVQGNQNVELALQALITQQIEQGKTEEAALKAMIKLAQDQDLQPILKVLVKMQQESNEEQKKTNEKQESTNAEMTKAVESLGEALTPIKRFSELIFEGVKPKKGEEYFTEEEQAQMKQEITPVKGKDYFTDEEQKEFLSKSTPKKGEDYFTDAELNTFLKQATPEVGKDYFTAEDITQFKADITPKKGVDYNDGEKGDTGAAFTFDDFTPEQLALLRGKDGSPDTPLQIVKKLESIKEAEKRLDISAIKGWEQVIATLENQIKNVAYAKGGTDIGWGGNKQFIELADTPDTYKNQALKGIRVNADETGLEFFTGSGLVDWGEIGGTLSNQTDLQAALNLKYDVADFDTDFDTRLSAKDTDDIAEGSNLYFTNARAISALTGQNISIFTNDSGYLTSESDTLQTVTGRGATTNQNITIDNGGLSNNDLNINGSTHSTIRSTATDLLQFIHGGSARITVNSSGNVGIGTTEPQNQLHVHGSTDSILRVHRESTTSGDAAGMVFAVSTSDIAVPKGAIFFERTGTSGIGSLHLATDSSTDGSSVALSDVGLTITSAGNVGIGTTTPAAKLDVAGTGSGTLFTVGRDNRANGYLDLDFSGQLANFDTLSQYTFSRQGVEQVRIDNNGNVGIGTAAPLRKLQITDTGGTAFDSTWNSGGSYGISVLSQDSEMRLVSDSGGFIGSQFALVEMDGNTLADAWGVLRQTTNGTGDGSFRITYGSNANVGTNSTMMTILPSGNVGIGTTTPSALLHLHSESNPNLKLTGSAGVFSIANNLASDQIDISIDNTDSGADTLRIFGSGSDTLHVALLDGNLTVNVGKVGIGTTSPTAKLDIDSDVIRLRTAKTPASSSSSANTGDIFWDSNYLYIAVGTNSIKRVALSSF